jgi:hypothetical protein
MNAGVDPRAALTHGIAEQEASRPAIGAPQVICGPLHYGVALERW